jgi:protein required for attachment to host cells
MGNNWLLVANEGRARVFEIDSTNGGWREVEDCISAEATLPRRKLADDAQGQIVGGGGAMVHATSARSDLHDVAVGRFASDLMKDLVSARNQGRFDRLDIVAPPRFLGVLRAALPDALTGLIGRELHKDWSHLELTEMARRYVDTRDI